MKQLNLNSSEFLSEYWQKKPALIRNAFRTHQDIIDEHELAGLAMEEDIDSRIISCIEEQWQITQGPIEDFEPLCKGQWTLLVQGLENYLPEAQNLLDNFDFIPAWRRDDLMVSFSVAGAGVGPHLDQYDVFIIQGKGSRRWQVGKPGDYQETHPCPGLRQLTGFEPIFDEVLNPGDMIYIPPGHPHDGVALEDCLNYSVGFRAPTQSELFSSLSDFLLDNDIEGKRYSDPELLPREHSSEITPNEIASFREQLKSMLDSEVFTDWLGTHLTQADKFIPEPPEQEYDYEQIHDFIEHNYSFHKCHGVRYLNYQITDETAMFSVFINGEEYQYPKSDQDEVYLLLNSTVWQPKPKNNFNFSSQFIHNLSTMINKGLWFIQFD